MWHKLRHANAHVLDISRLATRRMSVAKSHGLATQTVGGLVRSIAVYRLCAVPFMPTLFAGVLRLTKHVPVANRALLSIVRHTVFKQFCGGETVEELGALATKQKSRGIRTIVDYAAEPEISYGYNGSEQHLADSYFDSVAANIHRSIDAAKKMDRAIVAVKCTGLFDSRFLRNFAKEIHATPKATISNLSSELQNWHSGGMKRLAAICEHAKHSGVTITIDAEQSYLQDSIDVIAMECMAKFNAVGTAKWPVVLNTYQMYRVDGLQRLTEHLMISQRDMFHFGCKLVRGAYLDWERNAAKAAGRDSVVMRTIAETHAQYDASVRFIVDYGMQAEESGDARRFHFMLATHNKESIALGRELASSLAAVASKSSNVSISFAQLYGMSDLISDSLAREKMLVYKYLPYGPVELVIPYLLRRVQENHTVFRHAQADGRVLQRELLRRVFRIGAKECKND